MTAVLKMERAATEERLTDLELNPERMELLTDGLPSLHWPVSIAELLRVRDRVLEGFFAWCRDEDVDRNRDAELLWLNAAQMAVEIMRLFNGQAVQRRLAGRYRLSQRSEGPPGLFQALARGEPPGQSMLTRKTLAGLQPDPSWRKALRLAKYAFGRKALTYRPKRLIRPARDIVTFSGGGLITAHAEAVEQPVVLSKYDEWMTAGALPNGAAAPLGSEALTVVVDLARDAFEAGGEALPDYLSAYLRDFLSQLCGRTRFHLEELQRQEAQLPHVFWSGTGGILFNRVMARAVYRAGGGVVGHDHGTGTGWWQTYYQTVTELNYIDRFVTYSESLAEGLRRNLRSDLLASPERPIRIEAVPRARHSTVASASRVEPATSAPASRPIETVMYVPTAYTGDTMYLLPLLADPVAVDWQCRLLAFLKDEGYEILIKPHPESYCRPPRAFLERFGARFLDEAFEAVLHQADCVVFDYLQTSCIVEAVRSECAMVLVEFPRLTLDPEARALLERRAGLVTGWFDGDGRAQVNWPALRAAMADAADRCDRTFADNYYP